MKNSLMRRYKPQMILFFIIVIEAIIMIGLVQHRSYVVKKQEEQSSILSEQAQQSAQQQQQTTEVATDDIEEVTTLAELPKRDEDAPSDAYKDDELRIVCLDAGLGGYAEGDSSETDAGMSESEYNLEFAGLIKKELNRQGIIVYMTREEDDYVNESDRTELANNAFADIMITITCDSYDDDEDNAGFTAWVHHNRPVVSNKAAELVLDKLEEAKATVNEVDAGTYDSVNSDFYTNTGCIGPSMVLGMGSVLNQDNITDYEENKEAYAKAVSDAIVEWFENQGL